MKPKFSPWYLGYAAAAALAAVLFSADLPRGAEAALSIAFAVVFSVTHVQLLHRKMLREDPEYRVEVMDERHRAIQEKTGSIANLINTTLLGCTTVAFIALDYIVPAVITGTILLIQPLVLIAVSNALEKKM